MTDVASPSTQTLCTCEKFELWYVDDGMRVCRCGHPRAEHIGGEGSCTGEVEVI